MAKPAWKTPAINKALEDSFKNNRIDSIQSDVCVRCHEPATEFSDEISRIEFTISGLCQKCQDFVFAPPPEEDK